MQSEHERLSTIALVHTKRTYILKNNFECIENNYQFESKCVQLFVALS